MNVTWIKWIFCLTTGVLMSLGFAATAADGVQTGAPQVDDYQAWQASAFRTLAAMPDADAKVTAAALARSAAMLAQGPGAVEGQAMPLAERAVALDPAAPELALFDIRLCGNTTGCDAEKRAEAMRHVDPENGAFFMAALHVATVRGDGKHIDALIQQIARARTFDLYDTKLGKRFRATLLRLPPPAGSADPAGPERQATAKALVLLATSVMPDLQDLVRACKPPPASHLMSPQRRNGCRQMAEALERGDTMIANMIGLRLQEWNARDASDKAAALAQHRIQAWRLRQLGELVGTPALPLQKRLALTFSHDREADAIEAMLEFAGKPLNPPDGWKVSDAKAATDAAR